MNTSTKLILESDNWDACELSYISDYLCSLSQSHCFSKHLIVQHFIDKATKSGQIPGFSLLARIVCHLVKPPRMQTGIILHKVSLCSIWNKNLSPSTATVLIVNSMPSCTTGYSVLWLILRIAFKSYSVLEAFRKYIYTWYWYSFKYSFSLVGNGSSQIWFVLLFIAILQRCCRDGADV